MTSNFCLAVVDGDHGERVIEATRIELSWILPRNRRAYATGSSPPPSSAAACVGVRRSTSKRVSPEVTSRDKVCSVVMPTSMCPSRSACAKALPDPTSEIVTPGADAVPALRGRAAGQNGLRAVPEAGDCSVPNVEQF